MEVTFCEETHGHHLHDGNAGMQQRGSGHLAVPGRPSDSEPRQAGLEAGTSSWVNQRGRGVCVSALEPRRESGKAHEGKPRSEPDWGNPTVRDRRGACGNVATTGAGLRPIGKPMDLPPDPTVACAPHFYPDRFRGLSTVETSNREQPSTRKELHDGRVRKLKPHDMGLQISRRLHPEVPRKTLYGELRRHLGEVFRKLAEQKE